MTKVKEPPPAVDLDALFAELDAPAREREVEQARQRAAEQQQRQAAAVPIAVELAAQLAGAAAADAEWKIAMPAMDGPQLAERLPPRIVLAFNAVRGASGALARLANVHATVTALRDELKGPVLPPARLEQIITLLRAAKDDAASWPGQRTAWTNVRRAAGALVPESHLALDVIQQATRVTPEELAAQVQHQQELDAAATPAMPPVTPKAPARGVPGAVFDGMPSPVRDERPSRAPAGIRNLQD
jgi:hypothetical protein